MIEIQYFLAIVASLLMLGVFSSKLSSRFNVPVLLMFLAVGMIAGEDGIGKIQFSNPLVANYLGTVAMAYILYSGGLDTNFRQMRPVLGAGGILATIGVFLTAVILGIGTTLVLGCSWQWGLLLGAVVSSTDAAAVFAILRGRNTSLKGDLQPLLELESGSNDPMAAFLTLFMIGLLQQPDISLWSIFPEFFGRMIIGILGGIAVGNGGVWLFNRMKLDYEGLYFVLGFTLVLFAYGFTETFNGNGFMACYVAGVAMSRKRFNHKKAITRFSDGISWLMQVILFTVLGLLVFPKELPGVALDGLLLALILMFVARPLAVMACLIFSKYTWKERLLISWVGLRGAAPIVFATFPLTMRVENADLLFNLVFFIVMLSVLFQGRTLMPFARLLKLTNPLNDKASLPIEMEEMNSMNSQMFEFEISTDSRFVNLTLAEMSLPPNVLVLLIRRHGHFILARGNTRLEAGDGMLMMGEAEPMSKVAAEFFPGSGYESAS